ncbi:MAG: hypothetical protein ACTH2Q_03995 [Propionibacteriaceae bacterium]
MTDVGAYATRTTLTDRTIPRTAKSLVRTAKDLHRFPLLQEAAEAGRLTRDQVGAALHGLTWVPDTATTEELDATQAELLASSDEQPPGGMRQLAHTLIAVHLPDVEGARLEKQLELDERRARRNRHPAELRCRNLRKRPPPRL